jgi:hypothetical protein
VRDAARAALEEQLLGRAGQVAERLRVDRVQRRLAGDPDVRETGLLLADGQRGDRLAVLARERDRRGAGVKTIAGRVPALLRDEILPLEIAERPE